MAGGARIRVVDTVALRSGTDAGIEFMRADLTDPAQAIRAVDGCTHVFHLAGNPSGPLSLVDPAADFRMNTLATFNVAHAAAKIGVAGFVHVSSALVYAPARWSTQRETDELEPFLPYAASKGAGETLVKGFENSYDLRSVVVRPFVVYGPDEDPRRAGGEVSQFARWHLNGLPLRVVGDIDRKVRDFIHVRDVAQALLMVADAAVPGMVVNIGTGRATSLRDLVGIIEHATGRSAKLEIDTSTMDDSYSLVADTTRLRTVGFHPRITLEEGVSELIEALGDSPEVPTPAALR
jgi:nucleoside-diphosphate-sugar epimerase